MCWCSGVDVERGEEDEVTSMEEEGADEGGGVHVPTVLHHQQQHNPAVGGRSGDVEIIDSYINHTCICR